MIVIIIHDIVEVSDYQNSECTLIEVEHCLVKWCQNGAQQ